MIEGTRVAWIMEPDNHGTVTEVTTFYEGDPNPSYFVEFDDEQFGIFDRSELMEVSA